MRIDSLRIFVFIAVILSMQSCGSKNPVLPGDAALNQAQRAVEGESATLTSTASNSLRLNIIDALYAIAAMTFHGLQVQATSGYINKNGSLAMHELDVVDHGRKYSDGLHFTGNHFVDKDGGTIGGKFSRARDFSEGFAAVFIDTQWSYMDTHGKLLAVRFDSAKDFHEGLAPVQINGRWGYIDQVGHLVIAPTYNQALCFSDGLAAVNINGKVGFIDRSGKVVIAPKYDMASSFSDGMAEISILDKSTDVSQSYFIDKSATIKFDLSKLQKELDNSARDVVTDTRIPHLLFFAVQDAFPDDSEFYQNPVSMFSNGLCIVSSKAGYGYADKRGRLVIPCQFVNAEPFSEGLACVTDKQTGKAGYIDTSGKFLIKPQYERANSFSEGLASVSTERGNAGGFIDHSGKMVLPIQGGWCGDFHNGRAPVGEPVVSL